MFAGKQRIGLNEAAALGDLLRLTERLDEYGIEGPRAGSGPEDIPLRLATWYGQSEAVGLLLERGYSPAARNGADDAGRYLGIPAQRETTPGHHADIVARLLDAWDAHWTPQAS